MGWSQVLSERQGKKMLSTTEMESESAPRTETNTSTVLGGNLLFRREVIAPQIDKDDDTDKRYLEEGYIIITPLGAVSHAEPDYYAYFKEWLPQVVQQFSASAL